MSTNDRIVAAIEAVLKSKDWVGPARDWKPDRAVIQVSTVQALIDHERGFAENPTPAASGVDDQSSWMGQALHDFTEYFVKNYPGPDTIICDPTWHAPKLFRNALWHIEQAQKRDALAAQPAPGVGGVIVDLRAAVSIGRPLLHSDVDAIEAALSARPAVEGAQGASGGGHLPEDGAYLICYDDQDEADELFAYSGARENAFRRYRDRSSNWNAHLYVKIDSNSRDCKVPSATFTPTPATGSGGEAPIAYIAPDQIADLERGGIVCGPYSERYNRTMPLFAHPAPAGGDAGKAEPNDQVCATCGADWPSLMHDKGKHC